MVGDGRVRGENYLYYVKLWGQLSLLANGNKQNIAPIIEQGK